MKLLFAFFALIHQNTLGLSDFETFIEYACWLNFNIIKYYLFDLNIELP